MAPPPVGPFSFNSQCRCQGKKILPWLRQTERALQDAAQSGRETQPCFHIHNRSRSRRTDTVERLL